MRLLERWGIGWWEYSYSWFDQLGNTKIRKNRWSGNTYYRDKICISGDTIFSTHWHYYQDAPKFS